MNPDQNWTARLRIRLHSWMHLVRFLAVGGLNTLFGYCLFSGMIWLKLAPEIALALSTVIGVMFNFATYGKLAFKGQLTRRNLPRFIGAYVFFYGLNAGLLRLSLNTLHYSAYVAQLLVAPVIMLGMFFTLRNFVFRQPA